MADLLALGVRQLPVVSRGKEWVSGQVIKDVARLAGIDAGTMEQLPPDELVRRINIILSAAQRFLRQMPDSQLETQLPNRPRSYRELGHHLFRIPEAFLELTEGTPLSSKSLVNPPPDDMRSFAAVADYGAGVLARVNAWWDKAKDSQDFQAKVPTYYGDQPMHDILERTTWHSGQHVRQVMMLLDMLEIEPDGRLGDDAFAGLPLPKQVWDG